MSCLEKQYASHKAGVRHPFNLDSFMDETDREVMNLTDRAFKSLCIGDEAIYNDSELVPSLVDCHKPLVEEKPKKPRENSSVKKHGAHRPNGVYNTPWQTNKNTSKVSSLFAALTSKKSNDMKMTNGDSWDKSALLSIQTELSEFSSDYQNHLLNKDFCQNKSHHIQDVHKSSGKSKYQHSKSTKLRKLNSKNFFLHSEFSPFQSWRDLNRFGLENMGLFRCSSPAGLYDSPLYTELDNSNILPVPKANKRETSQSTSPREPGHKSKLDLLQKTAPPVPEKPSELKLPQMPNVQIETLQPQVLLTSSGSFQRCQSEGDLYAPWRKNRSRAKGTVQPLISSPDCERANPVDECAIQKKKELKTVKEPTCLNSTPFNILQLLTPIIPSRQGTGTSDILQAVHSPAVLDIPGLHETEIRPSPDIKREGYKSKASGLLFNLKDNRKRVKATYSPPKFKGLDAADQNKLSPLIEQEMPKDFLQSPEIADAKTASAVRNTDRCPMSPKTADTQSSQSSSHIKSALPDDFLGLSLLHAGSPVVSLKAKKNPVAKATYPSLYLYRKCSPVELNTKMVPVDVAGTQSIVKKSAEKELSKEKFPERDNKELQRKHNSTKQEISNVNREHLNNAETANKVPATLKEKYLQPKKHNAQQDAPTHPGSRNQEPFYTGETCKAEKRPIRNNECQSKEINAKHLFSARQNNYIKNERYSNVEEDEEHNEDNKERECWQEKVNSGRDEHVDVQKDKGKVQENTDDPHNKESFTNDAFPQNNSNMLSGTCTEQRVSKNAFSMKGNTSAKIALFTLKEQPSNAGSGAKKKNIVKDKYELATVALEKRIAEREQKQQQSGRQSRQDFHVNKGRNRDSILESGQTESTECVIPDRRGQMAVCDFMPPSQTVQSISDIHTSPCHVLEVISAEPYMQEGAAKHSPSRLIYTDRDRSDRHGQESVTKNIKSMSNELKETLSMPKYVSLDQEGSVVQDCFDNELILVEDESSLQKKNSFYKPEAPPRRERANSQSEGRLINERMDDLGNLERSKKEFLSTEVQKSNLAKDKGPVKGHVSLLKDKLNRKHVLPSLNLQECLSQEEGLMDFPGTDFLNQKANSPKGITGCPEVEGILAQCYISREVDFDDLPENDSKLAMGNIEHLTGEISDEPDIKIIQGVTLNEGDIKYINKTENYSVSEVLIENASQVNSKCHDESSVKEKLANHFPKSEDKSEKTSPLNANLNYHPDNASTEIKTLYDFLNQAEPLSSFDVKEQCNHISAENSENCCLQRTEKSPCLTKGEERKGENLDTRYSCSSNNHETKLQHSDLAVAPLKDVEKGEWVRCLIDSAHNLTPTCRSNASSPTAGKLALFKVKDNTFSASPVTKTVRPVLHKTVAGVSQPWSPRESLSGSEKGEEDPEFFKDAMDMQSPMLPLALLRIPQPSQSSVQVVPPSQSQSQTQSQSQSTTDQEKKGLKTKNSPAMPEAEEWQLVTSSFSEGIENCEMNAEDTVEEFAFTAFNTAPTESIVESKAPSERSESVCSGTENQVQGKPPAVPPKTEKALRRAMKLTTKRIQKAEAKSKSERGRSSEKGYSQKRERRHHSSDKVLAERSYQREHSTDRGSSDQSTDENSSGTSLPKTQASEGHGTVKKKDTERQLQQTRYSSLTNTDNGDANSSLFEIQKELKHKDQNVNVDSERLGRNSEKYLPHKLYRRAHSLDRFPSDKHEHRDGPASKTSTETIKKPSNAQTALLRQSSLEQTYGSPANNIVAQSFPMTQRKLLQDLNSGQYFVVDMPVQVKTKTFFDPETGRYVQLPVQSLEGTIPRAQSVEVVNAAPLMLYHGFVPMPVSSLP
ncbi:hypothetical protein C0J50_5695 [Silurus asotus]|uniref:DUF4585 domain-containing protein n=1 Tax=Silurus asotus TaxID=30991 RepID=A0AAD5FAQ1_SILAS|nr:hypothetical protein C0J50_5695 [Silurus asotus]